MNKIYDKIIDKIHNGATLDSEIIREIESIKKKDPEFDINWKPYNQNWSLLMGAFWLDRKELVEYFLLTYPNINVNHRSYHGNAALFFVDISILKLLIDHRDLDVNIQGWMGRTGLHDLCYRGRKAYVKELLLDARVNIMIRSDKGETARDLALERGYPGIVNMLERVQYTSLLRIPNEMLCRNIVRMIIEDYV